MALPLPIGKIAEAAGKITESIAGSFTSLFKRKEGIMAKEVDLEEVKAEIQAKVQDHLIEISKLQQAEYEAMLKDTASARDQNVSLQNSDKATWLSKNVAYIIDIFLTVLWGTVTIILFLKIFKIAASDVDMISLMALHGTVTAVFMTIVNFHRGSSKSSEDKQKHIISMQK
jgi:hypothetical protein